MPDATWLLEYPDDTGSSQMAQVASEADALAFIEQRGVNTHDCALYRPVEYFISKTLEARFWARVDKRGPDECWPWTGPIDYHGYGRIYRDPLCKAMTPAQRVSWLIARGPIPLGLFVCHRCDNPPCVNPGHLFLGTHVDNMADRTAKGRDAMFSGEKNGGAKLTAEQVRAIRAEVSAGAPQKAIVAKYGIGGSQVSRIVNRQKWKRVQ